MVGRSSEDLSTLNDPRATRPKLLATYQVGGDCEWIYKASVVHLADQGAVPDTAAAALNHP